MLPLIVNFAPTGMVPTKSDTPYVPISPSEIVEQVLEACDLGITIAHLHARDTDGQPTHRMEVYRQILEPLRQYRPDLVICVSLSGRRVQDFESRAEVLDLLPDMGSLTLGSLNFKTSASMNPPAMIRQLAQRMNELGVHPELECFDSGMVHFSRQLASEGILSPPFYYNLLLGNAFTAPLDLLHAGLMVRELPPESHWAMAGLGKYQLAANAMAIAMGGGVRVGLEDNVWFDRRRSRKATNRELLMRIHELAAVHERPLMSSREFGELGFYNARQGGRSI
jgi:uncharacterized protein (DUF849 family)